MRLRWSQKKSIMLLMLGIAFVVLWRVYDSPAVVLTPVSCTPLASATYATSGYTLQMDGTTPVVSAIPSESLTGAFTGALIIFCSPRGEVERVVSSPFKTGEHLHRRSDWIAWSAHHGTCAYVLYTKEGNRLYVWQDGQWRWSVPLPGLWKYTGVICDEWTVAKPFNDGRVLCYRTGTGEYLLAGGGQILARGKLPLFMKNSQLCEYFPPFTENGTYCYTNDNRAVRIYHIQLQHGRLTFHAVRAIPANDEIRALFNTNPPMFAQATADFEQYHQSVVSVYDMQGKRKSLTSPRCTGSFEALIEGNACGGTITSTTIGMAQVRSGKTWSCRRLASSCLLSGYTSADGQSLLVTIQRPTIYDPMDDRFADLPLIGAQCVAFRHRQRYRQQGLYEAVTSSGRHHALFHLSGVYQQQEYQLSDVCLLPDGHTILALAEGRSGKALLRYQW